MSTSPYGRLKLKKAWNCNATSKLEVVGKTFSTDVEIAVHAYSVRTTMPSLVPSPKFPTFPTYKNSITLLIKCQYVMDKFFSIRMQKY